MTKRILICSLLAVGGLWFLSPQIAAGSGSGEAAGAEPGHGLDPVVLAGVAAMLIIAKLSGELFERFRQPAVLGELIGGIFIGNLTLLGVTMAEPLKTNIVISALAELGVIILLFEVGLESDLGEMLEVGWSSLLVAAAGVVAPFFLGWGVSAYFLPGEPILVHIFIGATLCATSVGITARVLKDLNALQTREARIILGAAVIDDVLGLLVLAVVAGAIKAELEGAALSSWQVIFITLKALAFLVSAILGGRYLMSRLFRHAGALETRGVLLALAIAFCFLLAWLAAMVGLAPIVGAFAAGIVLDEAQFKSFRDRGEHRLEELLQPVSAFLTPIFFVLVGLKVDLRHFARWDLLGFATTLTLVAILGKQICSFAVMERQVNRLAVGIGMTPRGEVGLIFAGIGATLMLPNQGGASEPVIDTGTFSAVVFMVVVTTLLTPPALKWALRKS
jgi:Kef-type K+ transport system membrane component KefB